MISSLEQTAYVELYSDRCFCGAHKKKAESFCRKCYFALPAGMRNSLYKSFRDGYAVLYDKAKDWLQINTDRLRKKVLA